MGARPTPLTLAGLATRVMIALRRAEHLHSEGRLPVWEINDPNGQPLWDTSTVDRWCEGIDPAGAEDPVLLLTSPTADAPAERLFYGVLDQPTTDGPVRLHTICWGTEHCQVLSLHETDDTRGDRVWDLDHLAVAATQLISPRLWATTIVLLAGGIAFDRTPHPRVSMYQLTAHPTDHVAAGIPCGPKAGRSLPPIPIARFVGDATTGDVARVIGTPVPMWLDGTCLPDIIEQARTSPVTVTVPDTITTWPQALARMIAARTAGLKDTHPAAYAMLAADTSETLASVRDTRAELVDGGDSWYLAAVPQTATLPLEVEAELTTPPTPPADQIITDLVALRRIEATLPVDKPEGEAFERAVQRLRTAAMSIDPRTAADALLIQAGTLVDGPITERWRASLTPHPDPAKVWNQRRGQRLLRALTPDEVSEILIDDAGLLVALERPRTGRRILRYRAEWPTGLPAGWTQETVIAGDHGGGYTCGPVFALTPDARGHHGQRISLIPALTTTRADAFAWGNGWSGQKGRQALYDALLRIALNDPVGSSGPWGMPYGRKWDADASTDPAGWLERFGPDDYDSTLWNAITGTNGPLELRWTDVRRWARHDDGNRQLRAGGRTA